MTKPLVNNYGYNEDLPDEKVQEAARVVLALNRSQRDALWPLIVTGFAPNDRVRFVKQPLTRGDAIDILDSHNNYNLQRPKKEGAIQLYCRLLLIGNAWVENTQVIILGHFQGQTYLLDGQNRLHAVSRTGVVVRWIIMHIEFDTLEDLAKAYASIDGGVKRTTQDQAKAILLGEDNRREIAVDQLPKLKTALALPITAFNLSSAKTRQMYTLFELDFLLRMYEAAAVKYFAATKSTKRYRKRLSARMIGSAVMGVGLQTYQFSPGLAKRFWGKVAEGMADENDIRQRLHVFIDTHTIDALTVSVFARAVAFAWNMFASGAEKYDRPIAVDDLPSTDVPIMIIGTPFDGKADKYLTLDGQFVLHASRATIKDFPSPKKIRGGGFVWEDVLPAHTPTPEGEKLSALIAQDHAVSAGIAAEIANEEHPLIEEHASDPSSVAEESSADLELVG